MAKYIYEYKNWTDFTWENADIHSIFGEVRWMQGKIIGIYSSIPSQGKSTIRDYLVNKHGFRHLPFARLIKQMIFTLLIQHGYRDEDAIRYIEIDKEVPLNRLYGMPTARFLMQTLGTDWGRNQVHVDFWVAEWEAKASVWSRTGVSVITDDMRFPNEMEAVKRLGGKTWRVERPGAIPPVSAGHVSEGCLSAMEFDRVISNAGCVTELYRKVDKALKYTRTGVLEL
jgi:hypothetical protein